MADDVVFIWNSISSQHVSGLPGNIQGFATAIPLQHRDHLWYCPISARIRTLEESLRRDGRKHEKQTLTRKKITYLFCSISLPKARHDCNPMVISVNMSAIFFCISWFLASGTPNWILIEEKVVLLKIDLLVSLSFCDIDSRENVDWLTDLSRVYWRAAWKQNSAAPSAPHEIP